jgi:hypothetical protein
MIQVTRIAAPKSKTASFNQVTFTAKLSGYGATVAAGIYDDSNTPTDYTNSAGAYPGTLLLDLGTVQLYESGGFFDYTFTADPTFVFNSGSTYYSSAPSRLRIIQKPL